MKGNGGGGGGAFYPFKKERGAASDGTPASTSSTAENGGGNKKEQKEGQSERKARRCWSPELHRRFLQALKQLGGSHGIFPINFCMPYFMRLLITYNLVLTHLIELGFDDYYQCFVFLWILQLPHLNKLEN